ncbi:MAG: DUF2587 domain-containing protein [Acidimicrobiaceae bacterium]|nr:DUF2587 domain-containing protein [Acidimicrobiaceae bacterium]
MSDTSESTSELVAEAPLTPSVDQQPDVSDPAKLIRLGTMLQTMLTELKDTETDDAGLMRLDQIRQETIEELGGILSDDLHEELLEFNACCGSDTPSESEMRVAHAQLVGWIQGLLRGMQATATAQAQMAQQQMMMMQAQMQQQRAVGGQPPAQGAQQPRNSGPAVPDSGYL